MSRDQSEKHAAEVDAWIDRVVKGLTPDQLVPIFVEAIEALQKRIVTTLSEVTFNAILDRVLHESQKKWPLLSGMKIESERLVLDGLLSRIPTYKTDQITEAFRFFFIELLSIVENLTAGIMTDSLYKELLKVPAESIHSEKPAARLKSMTLPKVRTDRGNV